MKLVRTSPGLADAEVTELDIVFAKAKAKGERAMAFDEVSRGRLRHSTTPAAGPGCGAAGDPSGPGFMLRAREPRPIEVKHRGPATPAASLHFFFSARSS